MAGPLCCQRLQSCLASSSPADERALGATWASVVEVMLSERVAGEDVCLVPSAARPKHRRADGAGGTTLPFLLRTHVSFALTAFDPPGETRTLEQNAAANAELWAAIRELKPEPAAVWPTWGYNLKEGWREDGFCLAYPVEVDSVREKEGRFGVNFAGLETGLAEVVGMDAGDASFDHLAAASRTAVKELAARFGQGESGAVRRARAAGLGSRETRAGRHTHFVPPLCCACRRLL